ncbi:unnamed protein product [Symbiodinium natans]|uniref:Uncharacterized protein n=1 Tax=Symbiodinium natans TaxID=878477 RepID=A0A812KIT0_9DINO|nr:unnamed protein product [Symbiodinium natans]
MLAPARELDPVIPVCVAGRPSQYAASAYFRRKFMALFRESSPKFTPRPKLARYCQDSVTSVTSSRGTCQVWPSQDEFSKVHEDSDSSKHGHLQHDEGMALAVQRIRRLRSGGNHRGGSSVAWAFPGRKDHGVNVGRR